MKNKICAITVLLAWAILTVCAWLKPEGETSDAERRQLARMPEISAGSVLDGSFMADFETYTLDQFPLRDTFRQVKSLFHYYALGQKDNNGIYIENGYAAQQMYPLNETSVSHALERFSHVYEKYLADSGLNVYMAVVPDKGYYLAEPAGQPAMDYDRLFSLVEAGMPWAEHIDLTDCLGIGDYYRTDTHWRQEKLLPAAERLCNALGVAEPEGEAYTLTALERPFYGVYYGQAALPMAGETMYFLNSERLESCTVYDYETGRAGSVYDMTKLESKDLYDVYLSGARALLTIDNPNGASGRELIVFRDSFGSAMVPLLVQDYAKVTLIDLRYIGADLLERYLEFEGQDVLFLYSTLVLNNSASIK